MAFDPDAYIAEKTSPPPSGGFDPDAYLASSAPPEKKTWGVADIPGQKPLSKSVDRELPLGSASSMSGRAVSELIREAVGAGEAGATMLTGGLAGLGGMIKGVGAGSEQKEQVASEFMEDYTYQPRFTEGKRNVEAIQEALDVSKIPMLPEYPGVHMGVGRPTAAAAGAREVAGDVATGARRAVAAVDPRISTGAIQGATRIAGEGGVIEDWKAAQAATSHQNIRTNNPLTANQAYEIHKNEANRIRTEAVGKSEKVIAEAEAKAKTIEAQGQEEAIKLMGKSEAAKKQGEIAHQRAVDSIDSTIAPYREHDYTGSEMSDTAVAAHEVERAKMKAGEKEAQNAYVYSTEHRENMGEVVADTPGFKAVNEWIDDQLSVGKTEGTAKIVDPEQIKQLSRVQKAINGLPVEQQEIIEQRMAEKIEGEVTGGQKKLPAKFTALTHILRDLNDQANGLGVKGYDAISVDNAKAMADKLRNALDEFSPEYADYREKYGQLKAPLHQFEEALGSKLTGVETGDRATIKYDAQKFPSLVFKSMDSVYRFKKMVKNDGLVNRWGAEYASRELREKSSTGVAAWINDNSSWLEALPEVKKKIEQYRQNLKDGEVLSGRHSSFADGFAKEAGATTKESIKAAKKEREDAIARAADLHKKADILAMKLEDKILTDKEVGDLFTKGSSEQIRNNIEVISKSPDGKENLLRGIKGALSEVKPKDLKESFEKIKVAYKALGHSEKDLAELSQMVSEVDSFLNMKSVSEEAIARSLHPQIHKVGAITTLGALAAAALGVSKFGMGVGMGVVDAALAGGVGYAIRGYGPRMTALTKQILADPALYELAKKPNTPANSAALRAAIKKAGLI